MQILAYFTDKNGGNSGGTLLRTEKPNFTYFPE